GWARAPLLPRQRAGGTAGGRAWATGWTPPAVEKGLPAATSAGQACVRAGGRGAGTSGSRERDGGKSGLIFPILVPHARVLAAPVSTGFPCTPTPRCQPISVTSWSA